MKEMNKLDATTTEDHIAGSMLYLAWWVWDLAAKGFRSKIPVLVVS